MTCSGSPMNHTMSADLENVKDPLQHPVTKTKNNKKKNASLCPNGNAGEEEKLLAFSYLFVPLLFLGMKGRERKKKRKINDVITGEKSLFCNSHTTVQEEHRVSGRDTQNIQS